MARAIVKAKGYRKQNAELTYRANRDLERHGWLRLTPAYSRRLVGDIVAELPEGSRVLDPFSGTATTTLTAAQHGHSALSTDINPFLVWLGNAKLASYSRRQLTSARKRVSLACEAAKDKDADKIAPPPIFNIERWWSEDAIEELCALAFALGQRPKKKLTAHRLLWIAFCRAAIESSRASFGHQSMSFSKKSAPEISPIARFEELAIAILESAHTTPSGTGEVRLCDARTLDVIDAKKDAPFDAVVTSPPYANRMSYIRELRPYMYWTGFLNEAREAGELDWQAIGGTWGVATSRLKDWERDRDVTLPRSLVIAANKIGRGDHKNAEVMKRYVAKYFEDAAVHLSALKPHLKPGAALHYIVGNSKFYDVVVSTEKIYAQLMEQAGFSDVAIRVIRKRNSKKELYEYDVTSRYAG